MINLDENAVPSLSKMQPQNGQSCFVLKPAISDDIYKTPASGVFKYYESKNVHNCSHIANQPRII